jgi:hypothetical protein
MLQLWNYRVDLHEHFWNLVSTLRSAVNFHFGLHKLNIFTAVHRDQIVLFFLRADEQMRTLNNIKYGSHYDLQILFQKYLSVW